jgi:hypothetical protein
MSLEGVSRIVSNLEWIVVTDDANFRPAGRVNSTNLPELVELDSRLLVVDCPIDFILSWMSFTGKR